MKGTSKVRHAKLRVRREPRDSASFDQTAARWRESIERTEKMIGLLTEIRDHMARIASNNPASTPL